MTGGVPEDHMFFCGEPTADGDQEAYYLRQWYEANCPELHLGGWLAGLGRWARRIFLGYVDYDVNRDRDHFMGRLADEAARIRKEKVRQLTWLRTGVKPALRVREGGYYRQGDGQKVGPMFQMGGVWYAKGVQGDWDGYGRGLHGLPPGHPQAHEYDLVAVWEESDG